VISSNFGFNCQKYEYEQNVHMNEQDMLFTRMGDLSGYLRSKQHAHEQEIVEAKADYLLSVNEQEYCDFLVNKYTYHLPVLHEDEKYQLDPVDTKVDRGVSRGGVPVLFAATRITIRIPFEGNSTAFHLTPSTYSYSRPFGKLHNDEVQLEYTVQPNEKEELKRQVASDLETIRQYIAWMAKDVETYNKQIAEQIPKVVAKRKAKFLSDQDLGSSLGIPLKKRPDAPATYSVPARRKETVISRPQASAKGGKLDPTLDQKVYEEILEILNNMSQTMEKSPQTFQALDEEEIRNFFLVTLNSQYQLHATGETFNKSGKTDILVSFEGHNVFAAECKFWHGEKELHAAIDQLLSYVTWRDTKTALIVFSKKKDFTAILKKIEEGVTGHPCYVRSSKLQSSRLQSETIFSFVFRHPNDAQREIKLTVMAFDIPAK
jgi:hypothetical protein